MGIQYIYKYELGLKGTYLRSRSVDDAGYRWKGIVVSWLDMEISLYLEVKKDISVPA